MLSFKVVQGPENVTRLANLRLERLEGLLHAFLHELEMLLRRQAVREGM